MSFWQTEWMYLSEMCLVFKMMSQLMDQMIVHEDNIKRNLNMTHGLIVSERVMPDLARYVGSCVQMVDDVEKKWRK